MAELYEIPDESIEESADILVALDKAVEFGPTPENIRFFDMIAEKYPEVMGDEWSIQYQLLKQRGF